MFNFDTFKEFLLLTKFGKLAKLGKFGRKIRQICLIWQLSLSFKKTQKCKQMYERVGTSIF